MVKHDFHTHKLGKQIRKKPVITNGHHITTSHTPNFHNMTNDAFFEADQEQITTKTYSGLRKDNEFGSYLNNYIRLQWFSPPSKRPNSAADFHDSDNNFDRVKTVTVQFTNLSGNNNQLIYIYNSCHMENNIYVYKMIGKQR